MRYWLVFIILLVLLILLLQLSLSIFKIHNFINTKKIDNDNNNKINIVVAKYNEDISFLNKLPFSNCKQIIYNKGDKDDIDDKIKLESNRTIINMPNVGRCDHTYLYHITKNYENLSDITIFIPGSVNSFITKKLLAYITLYFVNLTNNSVFIGKYMDGINDSLKNFQLNEWAASNQENAIKNPEVTLKPCNKRPFGLWYENNFKNKPYKFITHLGIFAVSKKHILQHPKSYYENLIKQLDDSSNPECGHYFERSWVSIFGPIPNDCLYSYWDIILNC